MPTAGYFNGIPDSAVPGQSGTVPWTSGSVSFANTYTYDATYLYKAWAGFAYSNVAVTGSAVFTNQYASQPGGGFASANYAIAYQSSFPPFLPAITLPSPARVSGFMIGNTTYAYGSMQNGDRFSAPLATGTGFFSTTATGFLSGTVTDSATFFLGKPLGGDQPAEILAGWQWFSLEPLGVVDRIEFSFAGSSQDDYGLTTPTYFAMDNLTISAVPEPGTWALLGAGVSAWWFVRGRRWGGRT